MASLRGYLRAPLVRMGIVLAAWAAITLLWTPEFHPLAYPSVAIMPVIGLLLLAAVRGMSPRYANHLASLVLIGRVLMIALYAVEVFSKGAVLRLLVPTPPGIAPDQTPPVIEATARAGAFLGPLTFVYAALIVTRTNFSLVTREVLALVFVAFAAA